MFTFVRFANENKNMTIFHKILLTMVLAAAALISCAPKTGGAKIIIDYNFFRAITVREIAHTLHMDSAYLTRIFTQKYGIAPKEYLIDRRIEYAKKLLRESDASIKEIAISVGYDDQLYFSRIFKKKEGLPPLEYRRKLK